MPTGAPMVPLGATLFGQLSLSACAEWLWSGYPVRHPDLKIIMSEGGIGWVAMLHDRLENIVDRSGYGDYFPGDLRPAEVLRRNFWFATIDDPVDARAPATRSASRTSPSSPTIPHGDGTWPDTQKVFDEVFGALPPAEVAQISHENAAALFRHPLPPPDSPHAVGLRRDRIVTDYATLLRNAYLDEVRGDALLRRAGRPPARRQPAREAARRCRRSRRGRVTTMRPPARDRSGIRVETGRRATEGPRARAADRRRRLGRLHRATSARTLPHDVDRYDELRDASSRPDDPALRALVNHAQAIERFLELEAAGDEAKSLRVLTDHLRKPA